MALNSEQSRYGIQDSVGQFTIEAALFHPRPQLRHEREIVAAVGPQQVVLDAAHLLIDHGSLDADLTLGFLQTGNILTEVDEPRHSLPHIQLRQGKVQQIHDAQLHVVREHPTLHFPA